MKTWRLGAEDWRLGKGFTLMELLIILILVGIIAAVAIPKFVDLGRQSRINTTNKEMQDLKVAILGNPDAISPGYWGDVGALPGSLNDLLTKPGGVSDFNKYTGRGWNGPYIERDLLKDAWGTDFAYSTPDGTSGRRFIITSYGPDQASGGGDDITLDVTF
mgnify:FL=1